MIKTKYTENKPLSPFGNSVRHLFRQSINSIQSDDSTDNIIILLTNTINSLNRVVMSHTEQMEHKIDRMDIN